MQLAAQRHGRKQAHSMNVESTFGKSAVSVGASIVNRFRYTIGHIKNVYIKVAKQYDINTIQYNQFYCLYKYIAEICLLACII